MLYVDTHTGWLSLEPAKRAYVRYAIIQDDLCIESPRDRWKAAYRTERLAQRGIAARIINGTIGQVYGARVMYSTGNQNG